jgi:hypothetical protein
MDDVKAAAKRLIAEAAIAEREMLHMYSSSHRPDYLTVAHAALEAVNDRARLLGEVETMRGLLNSAVETAFSAAHDIGNGKTFYAERDLRRLVERLETMAGSVLYQIWLCPEHTRLEWNDVASDAGDGDGER